MLLNKSALISGSSQSFIFVALSQWGPKLTDPTVPTLKVAHLAENNQQDPQVLDHQFAMAPTYKIPAHLFCSLQSQ